MGGGTPGRHQPTTLVRGIRQSTITGECSAPCNRYGEPLEGSHRPIIGLDRGGIILLTHIGIWRRISQDESQLPDFPGSSPTSAGGCTVVSAANRFTQARTHHAARMSCQNDAPSATTRSPARIASPSSPDQPPATFSAGVSLAPLNNPPEAGAANCPASLELPGAAGEGSSGLPTAATGVGPWTCVTNCTERSPP